MLLPFELDPEIIQHIIHSQAGSIGKAIIELVMNSVDAEATALRLTMTKEGFNCADDGRGFASRNDVLRYFGRFGTPHQEGDATYGRFRLGRGQIMAHAKTQWTSNAWLMTVDTRTMGYNYDLEDLGESLPGCTIAGTWYEPLNDLELMSAVQEVRDLVRYTRISVELNGRVITRDPAAEKWDFEDENAYYRVKEEGSVALYNQGVLVRHDPSHLWGAGGLIVTKKAIALNVSRSEILRKTCPVWKAIAKVFGPLADEVSGKVGEHRKTEARREKAARSLLSGDPHLSDIFWKEEVITLLPGKRHVTLFAFVNKAHYSHKDTFTAASSRDVPKGEAIAQQGFIQVVHPQTLERFGCHSIEDFVEVLDRVIVNVTADSQKRGRGISGHPLLVPQLVAFSTLKKAFVERTLIVDEKKALDKETRRAWVALRWCLQHYAGACMGVDRWRDGTVRYGKDSMHVLLGESNTSEAWTDGQTYLAINSTIVKSLKSEPMKTAAYIFGLVEHEVAHQGDSLDCGHDEAFYQRFHDITLRMAPERQRFMHKWLMKYTMSMEKEGQKASGNAWGERRLVERIGTGRMDRGLSAAIEDVSAHPIVSTPVPEQDMALLSRINAGLIDKGIYPPQPDWQQVVEQARQDQVLASEQGRELKMLEEAYEENHSKDIDRQFKDAGARIAEILGLAVADIPQHILFELCDAWVCHGYPEEAIRDIWQEEHERWLATESGDTIDESDFEPFNDEDYDPFPDEEPKQNSDDPLPRLDSDCHALIEPGETWWTLERNTASAGFWRVEDYLKWRHAEQADR